MPTLKNERCHFSHNNKLILTQNIVNSRLNIYFKPKLLDGRLLTIFRTLCGISQCIVQIFRKYLKNH